MEVVTDLHDNVLNLKATELRLGLPGTSSDLPEKQSARSNKRSSPETDHFSEQNDRETTPPSKVQVVGWPPVRSYRKNVFQRKKVDQKEGSGMLVKVSMDGAPYLRKIDLRMYKGYADLLKAVEGMFKCCISVYLEKEGRLNNRSEDYVPTYQDKDGDWMLVGDVPWDMFVGSCTRMRIMKGSDAKGFGC